MEQFIVSLPGARLEAYHTPFTFTGVDLFGPLTVNWDRGTTKRWACLFTCLTTRVVHLEVTPSLETDDSIMVLRQFIIRRGHSKEIWSDRGTNFVGANRELKEAIALVMKKKLNGSCSRRASSGYFRHLPTPICPAYGSVWYRLRRNTLRVQLEMNFSVISSWGHR